MAIIFELFIECEIPASADAIAAHFSGLKHTLLSGKTIYWSVTREEGSPAYGLSVSSMELSTHGINTLQDAIEITEAGLYLLHHLKSAPPFRYARADLEASLIWSADLTDFFRTDAQGHQITSLECVFEEKLYEQLGRPASFVAFRPGYWWRQFSGATYRPLWAGDQQPLRDICRRLFPGEYFKY